MNAGRPTREELLAAADRTVPDVIGPDLKVLFVGINPGLYTAWAGHHFARPGNRFWRALHESGFTERLLRPDEERELLALGLGITNLVDRASVNAAELSVPELVEGGRRLSEKAARYRPRWMAVLGVESYRKAYGRRAAQVGRQEETIGETGIWLLPNPSGLNAHYTPADLARLFADFRRVADTRTDG